MFVNGNGQRVSTDTTNRAAQITPGVYNETVLRRFDRIIATAGNSGRKASHAHAPLHLAGTLCWRCYGGASKACSVTTFQGFCSHASKRFKEAAVHIAASVRVSQAHETYLFLLMLCYSACLGQLQHHNNGPAALHRQTLTSPMLLGIVQSQGLAFGSCTPHGQQDGMNDSQMHQKLQQRAISCKLSSGMRSWVHG